MDKKKKKASEAQRARIMNMLDSGQIDRDEAQEIIERPRGLITLPPDHYRMHVTYAMLPSMDELKKEWGEESVSDIFDGRPFIPHSSYRDMDCAPGERTFYVHDAGSYRESEEEILWGAKQRSLAAPSGYRPATHQETYEFAVAHPNIVVDFVGLGSCAIDSGWPRKVVCVGWRVIRHIPRRILGSGRFGFGWGPEVRALLVIV